jgi:hypothetical protein
MSGKLALETQRTVQLQCTPDQVIQRNDFPLATFWKCAIFDRFIAITQTASTPKKAHAIARHKQAYPASRSICTKAHAQYPVFNCFQRTPAGSFSKNES